jgi:putative transposase
MVTQKSTRLSIVKQCKLLEIGRSSFYYEPNGESEYNLKLMRIIDEEFMEDPTYGSRTMRYVLRRRGYVVSRKRIQRLMRKMGLKAIYREPKTSIPNLEHKIYPYLLSNLTIDRPNQVWCTDITYIPMRRGFLYLVAVLDWYSRKVLSWRLSNTMDAGFCVQALEEALQKHGKPEIFNTDQGSQFTSKAFTDVLEDNDIKISMDGKGRWVDNVMIERLWRSLKYGCVYLHAFENGAELRRGLQRWFSRYNAVRPHDSLHGATPDEAYFEITPPGVSTLKGAA